MISMPNNNLNREVLIRIVQKSYQIFREAKNKSNMTRSVIANELAKIVEKEVRDYVNKDNQVD